MDEKLEALKLHVMRFCGWEKVSVKLNGRLLVVECETGTLVVYNLETFHEVYGRLNHIGYTHLDLALAGFRVGRLVKEVS